MMKRKKQIKKEKGEVERVKEGNKERSLSEREKWLTLEKSQKKKKRRQMCRMKMGKKRNGGERKNAEVRDRERK